MGFALEGKWEVQTIAIEGRNKDIAFEGAYLDGITPPVDADLNCESRGSR